MTAPASDAGGWPPPRARLGWILFDWSTQPFFTLVTTFVYAPFFASALAADPVRGQALWGYATGAAGIVIALMSPVLGAVADATGPRKPWIAAFGALLMAGSAALWLARPGDPAAVPIALVGFAIGTIGAEFATVFNNAMLPTLAPPHRIGRLSGTGWAVGYVGGLVSLVLVLGFLAADPGTGRTLLGFAPAFGLEAASREGDRFSGPLSALWFLVFVLPMFLLTPDIARRSIGFDTALRQGLSDLRATLSGLRGRGNIATFLVANMIAADGLVALFAFGGIYAAGVFGWGTIEIGVFGILLTVTGTLGAWVGGRIDDAIGPRRVMLGALVLLTLACIGILSLGRDHVLFVVPVAPPAGGGLYASLPEKLYVGIGLMIGIAAGPLQASARSLLVRLAPAGQSGQYFGMLALSGKVTSFLGPTLVAVATDVFVSQKAGLAVLIAFYAVAYILLRRVRDTREA